MPDTPEKTDYREHISRTIHLPSGYGKDRLVVMVRDPWWIFAYWEITPAKEAEIRRQIELARQRCERAVLRVYDITDVAHFDGTNAVYSFDIALTNFARNWYIDIGQPGRRWCIEIGFVTDQGNFFVLARSNTIHTPRFGISDIIDEAWMTTDEEYWWLFGASGGFDIGKSSLEMKGLFKRRLMEWISSGGISNFASHSLMQRQTQP